MKLTNNFSLSEFQCKCGCEMPDDVLENIKELACNLQYIREYLNEPLKITNAYRCKKHNKAVGGVKNSQHILGKAADIQCKNITPNTMADLIDDLISKNYIQEGGIGKYNTFTHYDIRGIKSRWNNVK
jgi:uncharacterized protein YcbK (DUF882 family)